MSELPIQINRCQLSRVGAQFEDGINVNEWAEIGSKLFEIGSCYQFLIGDWLNFGESKYGEKYTVACDAHEIDYGTARNWASVCGRIELSRRRDNLGFAHHVEVAKLSPKDQDKWLSLAEENKWPVAELREKLRDEGAEYAGEDHGKPVVSSLTVIRKLTQFCNSHIEDAKSWNTDQKAQWKEHLRPIVSFWEAL